MIELYDYQERAIEALREGIRQGLRNQVLSAPTGSGKTVMGAYLMQEAIAKGSRCIFVVDRISLINQTSVAFDRWNIPHGVIQGDHWRYRPHELAQIASAQTLARRGWPDSLDLIIIDECHTAYASTLERIGLRDAYTVGLTATPFSRGMGIHYDGVVSVTTTDDLIAAGRLAPYRIFAPGAPDMSKVRVKSTGEWDDQGAEDEALKVVGDVVDSYLTHAAGRKFIAFGITVKHCEEMRRQFAAAGIVTDVYSYRGTGEEKAEMVEEFRKPDSSLQGLISVSALAKGFDVQAVSCVIIARPLRQSLAEHVQMLGRGLRADPENADKDCIILDHAGNCDRFRDRMFAFFQEGAQELDDGKRGSSAAREEDDEKQEYSRTCPECKHVHKWASACPSCGYEYPAKVIEHEVGELEEMGAGGVDLEERKRWFAMLKHYGEAKGFKPGYPAASYKSKFGIWPPRSWNRLKGIPPDEKVSGWITHSMIRYQRGKGRWRSKVARR